jgi:FAD/FMN-containing dehydrogenase
MKAITRRTLISGAAASLAAFPAAPKAARARQRLVLNDASGLNPTPVFSHRMIKPLPETELIAALRRELKDAAAARRPVCVSAARHSMGGQSLPRNGVAITMDGERCEPDRKTMTFRVNGGARWSQVIGRLDKLGFSPAVMQSNADFGVAATFSVNAHGWPTPYGPFGTTVRSFRMMMADGSILSCSRTENAELFRLAMGGYGLFGILLDLDVEMVENRLLEPDAEILSLGEFSSRFIALANDPDVRMIYGRFNVARHDFFTEAKIVSYEPLDTPEKGLPPVARSAAFAFLTRQIYRGQIESEAGKTLRWLTEKAVAFGATTRNTLMGQPVSDLANDDDERTDILHEYFIAPERFNEFVEGCRTIIPKAEAEFLNVTLRHVLKDDTSVLSFAPTNRISAVMSFSQEKTADGEADMIATTRALIDLVRSIGGSFYLPYRLHARPDQLAAIYPRAGYFAERKRHYDPKLLFRNAMWDKYFKA